MVNGICIKMFLFLVTKSLCIPYLLTFLWKLFRSEKSNTFRRGGYIINREKNTKTVENYQWLHKDTMENFSRSKNYVCRIKMTQSTIPECHTSTVVRQATYLFASLLKDFAGTDGCRLYSCNCRFIAYRIMKCTRIELWTTTSTRNTFEKW